MQMKSIMKSSYRKTQIPSLYRSMMTRHFTEHVLQISSGPAAVTRLHICSNTSSELSFCWAAAEGWVDGYDLDLYDQNNTLQSHKELGKDAVNWSFTHLQPGMLYKMMIISRSGKLTSQSSIWARTGE